MTNSINFRELRRNSGLRQREVAEAAGLGIGELAKVERGLHHLDERITLRLLKVLGINGSEASNYSTPLAWNECGEGYVTCKPAGITNVSRCQQPTVGRKYILDLFCGVGGFSAGFEQTGQFEVVAGVDMLNDRLSTFASNHAAANAYGIDIRRLAVDTVVRENPKPFVIVGGPPCQGFSSIRPFRNIERHDPRNNLAEEFCRIVGDLRPEWIVFENVVGLLTHSCGSTLRAIQEAFEALGYKIDTRIMNAAYYGLPQRRERLIIVGSHLRKKFKWPEPTHFCSGRSMVGDNELLISPQAGLFRGTLKDNVTVDEALRDLPKLKAGEATKIYSNSVPPTTYGHFIRNGADVLSHHAATDHSKKMLNIIRLSGSNIHALPPGTVTSGFSTCYSRLAADEPSVTLTVNFVHPSSNRCIHPHQDRALTPREGARLQGFFDTFNFFGSRAQIVKQIGNAVPPILGRKIAEAILESD